MKLELRQLRHLLALDRHRNFARAAEAIGITQPALTRSLQAIEDSIGTRLFDRDRSRVEPTLVGGMLIREAQSVLARAADMESVMRRIVGVQAGRLRVGAGPILADGTMGTAVARMLQLHPNVRVSVDIADWPQLTDQVLLGELELAVAEISFADVDPRLTIDELPSHRATWFCRPGHPLTKQSKVTVEDLRRYPLAFMTLPVRLFAAVGLAPPESSPDEPAESTATGVQTSSFQMIRQVVKQCDAISLALPAQIRTDVARGELMELEVDGPPAYTNYGIIRLAHRTLSPAAKQFADLLTEVEREVSGEPASVSTAREARKERVRERRRRNRRVTS